VICHDSKGSELIVAKLHAIKERLDHQTSDRLLAQEHRPVPGKVHVPIDASERFSSRGLRGRRIAARKTSVQMPSHK
jgi:hypothetical protein